MNSQMDDLVTALIEALGVARENLAQLLDEFDDFKFIDFIGERDEVVTRGLRDRNPTTCTNSARVHKPSGARDALPTGCRLGLLLFPPKKSRHRRRAKVQKVCGLAHFAELPPQTHVDPTLTTPREANAAHQQITDAERRCRRFAMGTTETINAPGRHLRRRDEVRER